MSLSVFVVVFTFVFVFQGDANRSESDDEKKSETFEEDEKVEQLRDTGKSTAVSKYRPLRRLSSQTHVVFKTERKKDG